jgi:hypothetical protein
MTLSPTWVDPPAEPALGKPRSRWGQCRLEPLVQPARAGRSPVHRAQHLDVTGVEAEVVGQPVGHDIHDQVGDLLRLVLGEQEEVIQAAGDRVLAGVDAVGVGHHHPALLGLAEHMGQAHPGQGVGGEQVAEDLAGADAWELVDVADHHQVGVQGMVTVEGGLAAGAQLQQPVQGSALQPGQLGQPFSGAAGRRGQHHLGSLGAGQGDDGAHGVALAAARPPVSTATRSVRANLTAASPPTALTQDGPGHHPGGCPSGPSPAILLGHCGGTTGLMEQLRCSAEDSAEDPSPGRLPRQVTGAPTSR